MQWIKASERLPTCNVDVCIKDDMFHTHSDLGPLSKSQLEWLDESEASPDLEAEAKATADDYSKEHTSGTFDNADDDLRQACYDGYVIAARRYASTIDHYKAANRKSVETILQMQQENERLREAQQEARRKGADGKGQATVHSNTGRA